MRKQQGVGPSWLDRHLTRREVLAGAITAGALLGVGHVLGACSRESSGGASPTPTVSLPGPRLDGTVSLEEALASRRSVRVYGDAPVTLEETVRLLWAAQGVTDPRTGFRSAPSAGALYPLETYVVASRVTDLTAGVYRYLPATHALGRVPTAPVAEVHEELYRAALRQEAVKAAPAVLVLAAVFERTTRKYGQRGRRYVFMEAGHAAQNVYLQATALRLGTVVIGAFEDDAVRRVVGLAAGEEPLYLLPFGRRVTG